MASPERIHDLIIVGGGPAALSTSVNAASERFDILVVDDGHKIGGQAGTALDIRNYPGFPGGISGSALVSRMVDQALGFDTEFMGPTRANAIKRNEDDILEVSADVREKYYGKIVLLSMGVETRLLKARNVAAYMGRGVTYGPPSGGRDYQEKTVFIVGGGNSAGQVADKLADLDACDVHMIIRGDDIEEHMSGYLVDKVKSRKNINIHYNSDLTRVDGNDRLEAITVEHKQDGVKQMKADEVFVFIGSTPKTDWLPEGIVRDDQQFVCSGIDLSDEARAKFIDETNGRRPYANETSMHGVFAAGDVRSGSVKRVAAAVGDGVIVVAQFHNLRAHREKKHKI